jgi:hypothetical protein
MLFETYKSTFRAILLIIFVCLTSFPVQGQVSADKPSEEELGVEYLVQLAEMPRYMAYMVGTYERPGIKQDDIASIFDFELIYAYRREKQGNLPPGSNEPVERSLRVGMRKIAMNEG